MDEGPFGGICLLLCGDGFILYAYVWIQTVHIKYVQFHVYQLHLNKIVKKTPQAIIQPLLLHSENWLLFLSIFNTLGSFSKTAEWQIEMLCLRMFKVLDYISLQEYQAFFTLWIRIPDYFFLCLPVHTPKCQWILTVISFFQCHLFPKQPPTSC